MARASAMGAEQLLVSIYVRMYVFLQNAFISTVCRQTASGTAAN